MQGNVNMRTTPDELRYVRGQVGEQVVGEVISGVCSHAGGETDSDEEPKRFSGQHVEAGRLE